MLQVPDEIRAGLAQKDIQIDTFRFAGGGCINHAGQITCKDGASYFIKWNDARRYPGMLEAEARGLALLRNASTLSVPDVIKSGSTESWQYLVLQYIEPAPPEKKYWQLFGEGLARLHSNSSAVFGLDHDNYVGSLPQSNEPCTSWTEFFVNQRLRAQLAVAARTGAADSRLLSMFDSFYAIVPRILPGEKPALLHGDLWAGNLMRDSRGGPCLIDPAVYFGNREVDIAMTTLFGGFDEVFLKSYNAVYPLLAGFRDRLAVYNLYPLLVHLNLFGKSYYGQVVSILNRFV